MPSLISGWGFMSGISIASWRAKHSKISIVLPDSFSDPTCARIGSWGLPPVTDIFASNIVNFLICRCDAEKCTPRIAVGGPDLPTTFTVTPLSFAHCSSALSCPKQTAWPRATWHTLAFAVVNRACHKPHITAAGLTGALYQQNIVWSTRIASCFIASGAFHLLEPSGVLPELQAKLPMRIELKPLS